MIDLRYWYWLGGICRDFFGQATLTVLLKPELHEEFVCAGPGIEPGKRLKVDVFNLVSMLSHGEDELL